MKVTVTTLTDVFFTLDVSPDMEVNNFKALCSLECNIQSEQMILTHEGKLLINENKSLNWYGIKEGDVLLAQHIKNQALNGPISTNMPNFFDFSSIQIPSSSDSIHLKKPMDVNDPAYIRDMYLSNPEQLAILRHNNPSLAAALGKGLDDFSKVLEEQKKAKKEQELLRIRMLLADPFDAEAQKLIQEEIKRQNIDSNMETAMEYHPESFGSVTMLYINCNVNGYPVKAFIDSGAQSTIMSSACAERCHITRLIDTRWSGIAKGVGTQKIAGRIHLCQLQIEQDFLASSFTILESQEMDMLLGLDMLKRHQCCIDLKNNVLIIGTTGTSTRFLSENEIPSFGKNMF